MAVHIPMATVSAIIFIITYAGAAIGSLPGLAVSSNIGSAATIIGNPQNMLLGQMGHLGFSRFLFFCLLPSLISLAAAYFILYFLYRDKFNRQVEGQIHERRHAWPEYNRHQTHKGILTVILLLILFFTPFPRELTALARAGVPITVVSILLTLLWIAIAA